MSAVAGVSLPERPGQRASDQAYDLLLERVLDLRMPPGAVVHEQQLAEELGFGRMPVREALARLAGDRFITVMPRRGTVVTSVSLEDVLDMFDAREAIESGVAYLAARRATEDDLARLRELVDAAEQAEDGADAATVLRHDHDIHAFVVQMASNDLLHDAADRLLKHNLRFWRSYWANRPPQHSSTLSHAALHAALEARDSPAAATAMREHIAASRHLLQSVF
jgi:DNA-binding GntR family transcriptional regulator